jgi:hypothetical protein
VSISLWFYPVATNVTYDAVFLRDTGGTPYLGIYLNATGASAKVGATDNEITAETTTTYSAGTWNHAAGTFTDVTTRSAYLNGGGKATNVTPSGGVSSIQEVLIGGYFADPTLFGPMNGRLAEVGIWNVVLTDDEVLALSEGVSPLRVRSQNLVSYWPLYGNGSPEPNYSQNSTNRSLTLNNAPTQVDHPPVMSLFAGRSSNINFVSTTAPALDIILRSHYVYVE